MSRRKKKRKRNYYIASTMPNEWSTFFKCSFQKIFFLTYSLYNWNTYGQEKVDRKSNKLHYFPFCCLWIHKARNPLLAQIKFSISKWIQYLTDIIYQHRMYFKITCSSIHSIIMTFHVFKTSKKSIIPQSILHKIFSGSWYFTDTMMTSLTSITYTTINVLVF